MFYILLALIKSVWFELGEESKDINIQNEINKYIRNRIPFAQESEYIWDKPEFIELRKKILEYGDNDRERRLKDMDGFMKPISLLKDQYRDYDMNKINRLFGHHMRPDMKKVINCEIKKAIENIKNISDNKLKMNKHSIDEDYEDFNRRIIRHRHGKMNNRQLHRAICGIIREDKYKRRRYRKNKILKRYQEMNKIPKEKGDSLNSDDYYTNSEDIDKIVKILNRKISRRIND